VVDNQGYTKVRRRRCALSGLARLWDSGSRLAAAAF